MENNKVFIYDHLSGDQIEKEMTAKEKKDRELDIANSVAETAARQSEAEAKETAKAAILDRLGLTADEAKLLLG
jgi:hypothetical protein